MYKESGSDSYSRRDRDRDRDYRDRRDRRDDDRSSRRDDRDRYGKLYLILNINSLLTILFRRELCGDRF